MEKNIFLPTPHFSPEMSDKFLQIIEDGPRSDLIVTPVSRQYYSAFKCIAQNKIGRAEHMMELREAHLPSAVAQAKPLIVTATTITFDIIGPPTDLGMPIKAVSINLIFSFIIIIIINMVTLFTTVYHTIQRGKKSRLEYSNQ